MPDDLNTGGHPRKDDEHGVPAREAPVWPTEDPGDTSPPAYVDPQPPNRMMSSGMATRPPVRSMRFVPPEAGGRRRYVQVLAAAVVLGLVGAGVFTFAHKVGSCSADNTVMLKVSVTQEIEPAVTKAVGRFNNGRQEIGGQGGKCVQARVQKADPAQMTTLLGQGAAIGDNSRPDVWIPDSSLWASLLHSITQGKQVAEVTKTSVARSLIVVGMPQTFADVLRSRGMTAGRPSWDSLLRAGSGFAGPTTNGEEVIPPNLVKLEIPDPARNAAGLGSLTLVQQLWAGEPDERTRFTGMVRAMRNNTVPDVNAGFSKFERDGQGRYPVILASEQAVFVYNQGNPTNPALAVYPPDGSLSMDYPYTITTDDTEKVKAARMLAAAMRTPEIAEDVRAMGFRSADGQPPAAFGPQFDIGQQPVLAPQPAEVHKAIEVWYKLSKGIRNVTLLDASGSTNEKVAVDLTRLQATARATEEVLGLMSDDTKMGVWTYGTASPDGNDWRELVPVGQLSDKSGDGTRRQQVLSVLAGLKASPGPKPALYDSVLAAFRMMKRTYDPDVGNSVLVFTNGNNDDSRGTSLPDLLTALHNEYDPAHPVQIIMIGYGNGVAHDKLQQIADVTNGKVYVVRTPQEIQDVVLDAISRRACTVADC